MVGRCDWIPLSIDYLISVRDEAKATQDKKTLALVREISRLHWVLIKGNHAIDGVMTGPAEAERQRIVDHKGLLAQEPIIVKRKLEWEVLMQRHPAPRKP